MSGSYWDLSERERSELTREGVEEFLDYELMAAGVVRPRKAPAVEVPDAQGGLVDLLQRLLVEDWHDMGRKARLCVEVRDTFAEYLRMTGDDRAVAVSFLAKAFTEERRADAALWFDDDGENYGVEFVDLRGNPARQEVQA